jgi:hypothetical protein
MKRGQVVKILLADGTSVNEGIKHIKNNIFFTKHYSFVIGDRKFMPREDGVKGCCLLKKTTLLHKLTLGVL